MFESKCAWSLCIPSLVSCYNYFLIGFVHPLQNVAPHSYISPSLSLSACLSASLSPTLCLSICTVSLSLCLSVCLSVCLSFSISLSLCLFNLRWLLSTNQPSTSLFLQPLFLCRGCHCGILIAHLSSLNV